MRKLPRTEILSYDELYHIARAAVGLGIEKIRITGGEPLVRKGLAGFLGRLRVICGLKQLVLTTNGILLDEMAEQLKNSGIQRLNISLDSLKADIYRGITCGGDLSRVLAGIGAAEKLGFPIKINMVVMRGVNDEEVFDFVTLARERNHIIRFIEYMPTIKADNWQDLVVPSHEILTRIGQKFNLIPIDADDLAGPARGYWIDGGPGSIGVISPLSGHFCGTCNRIRVTSTGMARSCLFSSDETDLKRFLRKHDYHGLEDILRRIVEDKPCMHGLTQERADHRAFSMAGIGG